MNTWKVFTANNLVATIILGLLSSPAVANILSDDDQLEIPATGQLRYDRVRMLTVSNGAALNAFDLPVRFPKLVGVLLATAHSNDLYISGLSTNYPHLRGIGFNQTSSLSSETVSSLRKFGELELFTLDCPVENPKVLSSSLPKGLRILRLQTKNNITTGCKVSFDLPSLRELDIRGTKIDTPFFRNCHASNLSKLSLVNVILETGSLSDLSTLPKIRLVDAYQTAISDEDLAYLRKRHIRLKSEPNQKLLKEHLRNTPHR